MADRVLLDSNVLIAAIDSSRQGHTRARALLETDPRALAITGQNEREFLVALTRPPEANGYGATGAQAVADLHAIAGSLDLVAESEDSRELLADLVAAGRATGKQVHDANLVAVAVAAGAIAIVTANERHFERFADLITIEPLEIEPLDDVPAS